MIVGTCVKISDEIEVEGGGNPDSVTIVSIKDPAGKTVLEDTAMAQEGETSVWAYIWQTEDTFTPGDFTALIKAVKGDYSGKSEFVFELEAQT
ncbi:MAG: hypothetical protein KKH94_11300 [Candidatus Omnitrophica bacterium]|nr:hypothetical protein [Candidatus Omnitrophota bacterium]